MLSVLIALVRKGSLAHLGSISFRAWPVLMVAVGLRLLLGLAGGRLELHPLLAAAVYLASYACVLYGVYANRHLAGLPVLGAGIFLNALVIFANQARMPVSIHALERLGYTGEGIAVSYTHQLMGPGARLSYLADVLTLSSVLNDVFSIGDALIAAGLFWVIYAAMTKTS
jgi:hypothetical protein